MVAAGLIGVVIGFACGITVTIRTPDGSKMTMTVPDGSDVEIDSTGDDVKSEHSATPDRAMAAETIYEVGILQHAQGFWRVDQRHPDVGFETNGIDLVVVLGDRMYLFESNTMIAAGTVRILDVTAGLGNEINFHDVLNRQRIGGRIEIDHPFNQAMTLDLSTVFSTAKRSLRRDADVPKYVIRVRYSLIRIPHSDVADIEANLRSQLGDLGLGAPDERLSGVWRLVGTGQGEGEYRTLAFVVGFRGNEYFGATPGTNPTRYHYRVDSAKRKVETYPAPVNDSLVPNQPSMFGTYELSNGGMLKMRVEPIGAFNTEHVGADANGRNVEMRFERIGDFPEDRRELNALIRGQDRDVAMAMVHLFRAAGVEGGDSGLADETVQAADRESKTEAQLKQIGLAFHNFHDAYRKLPASAGRKEGSTGVASGKETYPFSWRVALLPFLENNELFEQYRFDEPWDSEHHLTLVPQMPEVYRSPVASVATYSAGGGGESEPGQTQYVGFAGELSALGQSVGNPFSAFRDGTSNTLLVVESQASVPWTKPEDLPYETAEDAKRAKPFPGQPLRFLGADGALYSMDPVDWEELAKWITRDGGEVVER